MRSLYERTCPANDREPVGHVLEEVGESFVKENGTHLSWMHPSYRDLVIEELIVDALLRKPFLQRMEIEGFKLALSEAGGESGTRTFPFMVDSESWSLLVARVHEYVRAESPPARICSLLEVLSAAFDTAQSTTAKATLEGCLADACSLAREKWDQTGVTLRADELLAYSRATVRLNSFPPMPSLEKSWEAATVRLKGAEAVHVDYLDAFPLDEWSGFIDAVAETEPRFLQKKRFPEEYASEIETLLTRVENELDVDPDFDDPADMRSEAARLKSLATTLQRLSKHKGEHTEVAIDLSQRLSEKAEALVERANREEEEEPEPDFDDGHASKGFDVAALFRDL